MLLNARHDSGDSNLSAKQPPSMHYLLHVPDFIDAIGPLQALSYRAVKITNDFYARQIKDHNQMGAELANVHIKFARLHAMLGLENWKGANARSFPSSTGDDKLKRPIDPKIRVYKRLFCSEHTVTPKYTARSTHRKFSNALVSIPVDENYTMPRTPAVLVDKDYVGQCLLFFDHVHNGRKAESMLVSIRNTIERKSLVD
ncbi:hypothetical protein BX661DRAFT_196859 [Kickxella alabastrina]|uniref:uncharacterized protein n=1 Tax=Kickxella alabastrina TaxID=61397 RepID=UPI00221EDFF3|nr:uncharacterized protein BX661DRAFT_196859 [Kickxella alabastrina]KAI7832978.1 hypothetical protein BX661DRAFT_196859 [Kickxella alabastrina]